MRVLGQDSRLSTVGRPLLSSRASSVRPFAACGCACVQHAHVRISALASVRVCVCVCACAHARTHARLLLRCNETPARSSRPLLSSFLTSLSLSSFTTASSSFSSYCSSSTFFSSLLGRLPTHDGPCRTVIRSLLISREEANRPLQTLFSFADARRPSLMKSHGARTHKHTQACTATADAKSNPLAKVADAKAHRACVPRL